MVSYRCEGEITEDPPGKSTSPSRQYKSRKEEHKLSKEEMIQEAAEAMRKMYYEDVEFFFGMIKKYEKKRQGR